MSAVGEADDGHAITAVQHVPEKSPSWTTGRRSTRSGTVTAHCSPGDTASDHRNSGGGGTVSGTGALGHRGVVRASLFSLRLNVAAEDGGDRLLSSAGTDTQYRRFRGADAGALPCPSGR
ncbi:hypothetical protein KCP75_09340 [Salmonella enterica subsp. enterica]|nr:hypothetical protein KCP75_09340 [Salmonella enterica subsp. enterica]